MKKYSITNRLLVIYIFLLPLFASNSIFGRLPLSIIISGGILFIYYTRIMLRKKVKFKIGMIDKILILFLFFISFSMIFARDKSISIDNFISLSSQILLYIFIKIEFVDEISKKSLNRSLVFSSLMVSIINIYQVRESIIIYGYKSNEVFANINYYATISAFMIPIAYELLKAEKKKRYIIIIMINLSSVLFSFSKASLAIIFIYILFVIFDNKKVLKKILLIVFVMFIAILVININSELGESLGDNYNKMISSFINGNSFSSREVLNNVSLNMIRDNFLTGVGLGNYPIVTFDYSHLYYMYYPGTQAHNLLLSLFSEIGVLGTGVFIIMIVVCLMKIYIKKEVLLFFIGIIISLLSYGMGLESWYLWIAIAISSNMSMEGKCETIKNIS